MITNGADSVTSMPAVLGFRPNPCLADVNDDGVIDILDLLDFPQAFDQGC